MCVVSMVLDHYTTTWPRKHWPQPTVYPPITPPQTYPTQEEIRDFRELLDRAREYDKRNNEPDCEMDDKKKLLKEMADKLGVDISFIDAP